jgi:hypothetical protein
MSKQYAVGSKQKEWLLTAYFLLELSNSRKTKPRQPVIGFLPAA